MNIVVCQFCKKPFASLSGKICPACMYQIDLDFITVRDYIYEHNHAGIDEISEETEVSKQVIIHLLKEGRLIIDGPAEGGGILACEVCKKPINTGRMCEACKKNLTKSIDKAVAPEPEVKKPAERSIKEGDLRIR